MKSFNNFNNLKIENYKDDIVFNDITHEKSFNYLKPRRLTLEDQKTFVKEFYSKKNRRYYIAYKGNSGEDAFFVYDADELDNLLDSNPRSILIDTVGGAVFDTSKKHKTGYFTGFTFNNSIDVKEKYKREGIATAITKFAEYFLNAKYRPSNVLSDEMKGFTKYYMN